MLTNTSVFAYIQVGKVKLVITMNRFGKMMRLKMIQLKQLIRIFSSVGRIKTKGHVCIIGLCDPVNYRYFCSNVPKLSGFKTS